MPAPPRPDAPSTDRPEPAGRQRWMEGGLIFAFWTLFAVLLIGSRVLDGRGGAPDAAFVAHQFVEMYLWAVLTPFIFWISRRFSVERSNWRARIPLHVGVAVLVSLAVELLNDLNIRYIAQPPWADEISFNPLEALLELGFLGDLMIYLAVLAAGFARDYFLRYQERRALAVQLQAQLTRARLEALRMQINPHFLFNTLHAIASLVERDPQGVRRMVARLSDLLRYALDESDTQEVPLRQELQFLDDYLDIQRIRFQGRLEVERHVAPEALEALVPPFIMQPLVENAVKHGLSDVKGAGRLVLRAGREGGTLRLSVADNGPGLPTNGSASTAPESALLEEGVGLRNTRARLRGLYSEAGRLTLENAEAGGLRAQITLPYHTAADLHTTAASH